jgi:dTDP-4-amino-4,6-dideoxygalactose transaminase
MIPFNRPHLPDLAFDFIRDAMTREKLSGDGHYTHLCEEWIQSHLGVARALLTTSCTSALEAAVMLLSLGPGDEVIVPSFTFVSCANAVTLRGATPVFADIDKKTLAITPETVAAARTERTKAVLMVHYGGTSRDAGAIAAYCRANNLFLIEDAAHAFIGKEGGQSLGTFGDLATLSFHETKNFSMGEGGALLLSESGLIERAEIIREKGTNRKQFFRGAVDKYSWVDIGSSYVASDLLAAILWSQLLNADWIMTSRSRAWQRYFTGLRDWASLNGVALPFVPAASDSTHHTFFLLVDGLTSRSRLLDHLRSQGIGAVFHYLPLETSPFGQRYFRDACPNSAYVSDRIVRLPLYTEISDAEVDRVVEAVLDFQL